MALPWTFTTLILSAFLLTSPVLGGGLYKDPIPGLIDDNSPDGRKTYIIQCKRTGPVDLSDVEKRESWYSSLLSSTALLAAPQIVHSYHHVISGFATRLTDEEVQAMSKMDWFVRAYPSQTYSLHTTRTPEFLGLHRGQGLWNNSNAGEGVIIGVLDSGVTPGHPSFLDDGSMPPPPAKWKGRCELDPPSQCNNKLIGARNLIGREKRQKAPVDNDGHGTHTASTAAGAFVDGATVLGNAKGVAAGMAPRAHLAIYKICSDDICDGADIAAAMDAAVADGVDVLSLSLGSMWETRFNEEKTAVGGFTAISKGIFVSCSAGNAGPRANTISNGAPWVLTVGASTLDRRIRATVKLGNGEELDGESALAMEDSGTEWLPLVNPAMGNSSNNNATHCLQGSLDGLDVKGKIVLCDRGLSGRVDKGKVINAGGAAGMILLNQESDGSSTIADVHVLPASNVGYADGQKIKAYVNSASYPIAKIVFKGTVTGTPAPSMASFSSRGPNGASPGILKPDITGPGVNVLAAWPSPVGSSANAGTGPFFNLNSGTSMSAPHLSGIAALLKSAHPDWSPAAIKSAIMTTADVVDRDGRLITDERDLVANIFAVGAGHVNPSKAFDPGLVYDIAPEDYIPYLCGLGYSDSEIEHIVDRSVKCAEVKSIVEGELNYPSIAINASAITRVTFHRTVTNVGEARSLYRVEVEAPAAVSVRVKPKKLRFTKVGQKKTFRVIMGMSSGGPGTTAQGHLRWVSPKHTVRSPIVVFF